MVVDTNIVIVESAPGLVKVTVFTSRHVDDARSDVSIDVHLPSVAVAFGLDDEARAVQ